MSEKNYANGIYGNAPSPKAPDFVVGGLSIKPEQFIEWLNEQKPNDKGYVRVSITRQKKDESKWSFALDTWEPKAKEDDGDSLPF